MSIAVKRFAGKDALTVLGRLPAPLAKTLGSCIVARNPFDPHDMECYEIAEAISVAALARRHEIDAKAQPVVCRVNGKWCLQKTWGDTFVLPGCVVEFIVMPAGGAGNFLRVALTLALIVGATLIAGPAGTFLSSTIGISATVASAIFTAVAIAGGSFLINAVLPPSKPGGAPAASVAASPTYTLGLQNNQARLGQPIPVLYGRHLIYPDYAATPYLISDGNFQYLRAVFVIGQGEYQVGEIRIGSTFASYFPGFLFEIVAPNGNVSLFDPNVYQAKEVTGQSLLGTTETGYDWIGPFPACPPGKTISRFELDFGFPTGLVAFDTSTGGAVDASVNWEVQFRPIDDDGLPLGLFNTIGLETLTLQSNSPQHLTKEYSLLSAARYEIRCRRTTALPDTTARTTLVWEALKGYLSGGSTSFGNVTLMAVQIQVSNSLAPQTSNLFNVIATRKLPIWNGTSWSAPTATRSIAWAEADVCRDTTYGAGLDDSQIDLAGLLELDAIWSARGDTFDAVFDQPSTHQVAREQIARVGRARPYNQSGMIRFYRDQPQTLPVTVFSVANIKLDTFQLEFAVPVEGETADGVTGNYFDETIWKPKTVTWGVGGATPANPASEDLFGVVQKSQADNETQYQAAANRYRRVFVTFTTEWSGLIPSPGDMALLAHDVPQWGFSGECVSYDGSSRVLVLAGNFELDPAFTWSITLRDQYGKPSAQIAIKPGVTGDRVVLQADPTYSNSSPFTIQIPDDQEPTHFAIGRASQEPRQVIITNIMPRGSEIQVQCVLEDPRVHVN